MKRPDVALRNKSRAQRDAVINFNRHRKHSEETKKKIGEKSKEKWERNRERYEHILFLLRTSALRRNKPLWEASLPRGDKHKCWKGGKPHLYRGTSWNEQRKLCLIRDGYKCVVCGEVYKKGNLDVHHITRYFDTFDNSLENLITLCKRCHRAVEVEDGKDN